MNHFKAGLQLIKMKWISFLSAKIAALLAVSNLVQSAGNNEPCVITGCLKLSDTSGVSDLCQLPPANDNPNIPARNADLVYEEAERDSCQEFASREPGMEALCCPKDSKEGYLSLMLAAERHQFPHFVSMNAPKGDNQYEGCGATIYNENYLITASHCVMDNGKMFPTDGTFIYFGGSVVDQLAFSQTIKAGEFIVHPDSTMRTGTSPTFNDIALVKLTEPIQFNDRVQALPLAPKDFEPIKYADNAVVIGVGTTDTLQSAQVLQRANLLIRDDARNIVDGKWNTFNMSSAPALLFLGEMQDGTVSPATGQGDSGGPAICRDADGYAVLCGVVSMSGLLSLCEQHMDKDYCFPDVFVEVSHYRDWIESVAGKQSKTGLGKYHLYGEDVAPHEYDHQVHITSPTGEPCGGTLISEDVVITAMHCVVEDNFNMRSGVKVTAMVKDLNHSAGSQTFDVVNMVSAGGYEKLPKDGTRRKRVAMLNLKPTPQHPYYSHDFVLMKLSGKVKISSKNIPKVGFPPMTDDSWATEVSFPLNTSRSGSLQKREFKLFKPEVCQQRLKRASYADYNIKVEASVFCGEERYNGGAQCDRELGGGLFCNLHGEEVLCGVQTFRFCNLALPSAFFNVAMWADWIETNKNTV